MINVNDAKEMLLFFFFAEFHSIIILSKFLTYPLKIYSKRNHIFVSISNHDTT